MNTVSKFLYWADVSDKVSGVFGFWGFLCSLCIIIGTIAMLIMAGVSCDLRGDDKITFDKFRSFFHRTFAGAFAVGVICLFGYSFIPRQKTLYAMAASEVGEQVVNSKAVQGIAGDATQALQAWIKTQLTPPKPAK